MPDGEHRELDDLDAALSGPDRAPDPAPPRAAREEPSDDELDAALFGGDAPGRARSNTARDEPRNDELALAWFGDAGEAARDDGELFPVPTAVPGAVVGA